jgi:CHAT domain-containing protein/tetratricopeptide (TPR) repeat protein
MFETLSKADADYARAGAITSGQVTGGASARDAFLRAAAGYADTERQLASTGDRRLRGETALALAGVDYHNLQDWTQAAQWARTAADLLGDEDPYRRARAQALEAAAWIELGPSAAISTGAGAPGSGLIGRARQQSQALTEFHLRRGETYDAALQLANVTMTYLYEGRYAPCLDTAAAASALFGSIQETERRAQAWQNRALCLWGLGRLPEALHWFERALADLTPDPYPVIYLGANNNAALAHYALGHFDESLRLFDGALAVARRVQSPRDEAQSLYGIGLDYYAIGDRERAQEFLERALAIRTVALDGRGRMATLRAVATIDAEQGRFDDALAADREALSLALAPAAIAHIRIQLAQHTAAGGHPEDAKVQLDEILAAPNADRLVEAQALLQRARISRQLGRPRESVADLSRARPRLHELSSVVEEFEANLELARAYRSLGEPRLALAAVERALAESDAVRSQSANPELRMQLEAPLRPAYDLKLDLLRESYERATLAGHTEEARNLATAAFVTADSSRARSFADVAAQRYSPALRRELASEFRQREELYQELAARRFALDARLDRNGASDPRAQHLLGDIAELQRKADALNTVIARRTLAAGVYQGPQSGHAGLPPLPGESALISYWLGTDSAYAWVVSSSAITWTRLDSTAAISAAAVEFHHALTRLVDVPLERRLQDGRTLYGLILQPLEASLSDARLWLVIPDRALEYVPFAALRTADGRFVAAQRDIALVPAAWMLDAKARIASGRPHGLLLVADPVYQPDDPRLTALGAVSADHQPRATRAALDPEHRDLQRLTYTSREAAGIAGEFEPKDVVRLLGLEATRERLLAQDWSTFRFIHIATHGTVDARVPQLSSLMLGSFDATGSPVDGAVRVADLSLETLNADVVVFSACETALGKEVVSEGLVGIRSTALARGARAVVASLWPVSDEMGARLMTEFYRRLLRDSMMPAQALGAAMRSVVASDGSADPSLWAAYQVSAVAFGPSNRVRKAEALKARTSS